MSEKKQTAKRHTITYPKYDKDSQMDFLKSLCEEMSFDCDRLVTLIFASWIFQFQKLVHEGHTPYEVFTSYIASTMNTYYDLKELKVQMTEKMEDNHEPKS